MKWENFIEGVGCSKDEDYRWAIFRAKIPPWLFRVFNFVFIGMCFKGLCMNVTDNLMIALIQNVLLFLMAVSLATSLQMRLTNIPYVLAASPSRPLPT